MVYHAQAAAKEVNKAFPGVDVVVKTSPSASAQVSALEDLSASRNLAALVILPFSSEELTGPVKSVKVPDMAITLLTESDDRVREPQIAWTPPDATDKGYALTSDNPAVVRVVGGSVEAMKKGEAKVTLTSHDGNKRDTFKVKVEVLIPCGTLLNPCKDDD